MRVTCSEALRGQPSPKWCASPSPSPGPSPGSMAVRGPVTSRIAAAHGARGSAAPTAATRDRASSPACWAWWACPASGIVHIPRPSPHPWPAPKHIFNIKKEGGNKVQNLLVSRWSGPKWVGGMFGGSSPQLLCSSWRLSASWVQPCRTSLSSWLGIGPRKIDPPREQGSQASHLWKGVNDTQNMEKQQQKNPFNFFPSLESRDTARLCTEVPPRLTRPMVY